MCDVGQVSRPPRITGEHFNGDTRVSLTARAVARLLFDVRRAHLLEQGLPPVPALQRGRDLPAHVAHLLLVPVRGCRGICGSLTQDLVVGSEPVDLSANRLIILREVLFAFWAPSARFGASAQSPILECQPAAPAPGGVHREIVTREADTERVHCASHGRDRMRSLRQSREPLARAWHGGGQPPPAARAGLHQSVRLGWHTDGQRPADYALPSVGAAELKNRRCDPVDPGGGTLPVVENAAFAFSVIAVGVAAVAAWYARRQAHAAEDSARESRRSADAAQEAVSYQRDQIERDRVVFTLDQTSRGIYVLTNQGTDIAYAIDLDAGDLAAAGEVYSFEQFPPGHTEPIYLVLVAENATTHVTISWHQHQDRSDGKRTDRLYVNR
jgi:hypothetical protein